MAKRKGRRPNFQNFRKVICFDTLALGTLAAEKVTAEVFIMSNATDKIRVSSIRTKFIWDEAVDQEGPIMFGVSHGDYTVVEIEEFIEAVGAVQFGDKIAAERSRRLIRILGVLSTDEKADPQSGFTTTKLNWTLGEGKTILFWAFNLGGTLTTGGLLRASGSANVWR